MIDLKGKNVTIVGMARSGIACARLLKTVGANVRITDLKVNEETLKKKEILCKEGIDVELGKHSENFLNSQYIVISPGVKEDSFPCLFAKANNIPVISEIEISWYFCKAKVIAVTGTNGKSTMVTLIAEILRKIGKKAFVLGNIGRPFSEEVLNTSKDDFVCLEVSSFQLEKIKFFKPEVAVFLNFSCDHLDRYKDLEEYFEAKKRIFMNQDYRDFAVLNYDEPKIRKLKNEIKAKVLFFREKPHPNLSCALKVCSIFGIDKDKVLEVFKNFKGLEHRLESVDIIEGVEFINDSKSTNVSATLWGLKYIKKPVILIAGGRDKGLDFSPLKNNKEFLDKVKMLILLGETKEKISCVLGDLLKIEKVNSLEEAVWLGKRFAKSGDCVLLSPMCASFDMFSDFEERGRVFKEIVKKIKNL